MAMLRPDEGLSRSEGDHRLTSGEEKPESPAAGAMSAFDTLRAIARGNDREKAGRLLAAAREAVCGGEASGIIWIVAAQQLEHEGEISRAAGAFLVAAFSEDATIATWDTDPEIAAIGQRIESIERAAGLQPGEYWRLGEGPPEWRAAEREWEEAFDRIWQALLRRFGEHELAELLERDRFEFERRVDSGQAAFLGER
jgi:hypothetical protein